MSLRLHNGVSKANEHYTVGKEGTVLFTRLKELIRHQNE